MTTAKQQQPPPGPVRQPSMRPCGIGPLLAAVMLCPVLSLAAQAPTAPTAARDQLTALQHVNLNDSGSVWIGFGGQLRERVEGWSNFNFGTLPATPTTVTASDAFALTRLLLSADLHAGPHLRVFAQGKSSLVTTRTLAGGRRPSDEDDLDVHQLYAELRSSKLGRDGGVLALKGGRFEMAYGRERLVSALDWANAKRNFEGGTASYDAPTGSVTAFWTRPVVVRAYQQDRKDTTTALFGLYSSARPTRLAMGADLYWIGQQRDSGAGTWNGTVGRERRHTVGVRLWGPTKGVSTFDLEGEFALQFGQMGSNAIRAQMFAGQAGYTFRRLSRAPRLYANLDYASGDESVGGDVGTFSQLNPQPHPFLGFADIIGRQNSVDLSGGGAMRVWRTMSGAVDYHILRRATATDAFYALNGAVARPSGFGTSKNLASEVDVTLRWPVDRHMLLLTGWSHVLPGRFIMQGGSASGADKPIDFTYLTLQYTL